MNDWAAVRIESNGYTFQLDKQARFAEEWRVIGRSTMNTMTTMLVDTPYFFVLEWADGVRDIFIHRTLTAGS